MSSAPTAYVPGYPLPKLLLGCAGIAFFVIGVLGFWPLLSLSVVGRSVIADTARVVMVTSDGSETPFTSDAALRDEAERQKNDGDRSARFWPILRFTTTDERQVEVRSHTGYRIPLGNQPFVTIRGPDGLPVPVRIWHDRDQPERYVIPWMWNTWFLPLLFLLFGSMTTVMGFLLLRNARQPIEIPDLSATADVGNPAVH